MTPTDRLRARLALPEHAPLEALLAALLARARTAWPGVEVDADAFVDHLVACLPADAGCDALTAPHASDLYLACGAARGQPDALRELERALLADVHLFIAKIDRSPAFVDEVTQQLRTRLLAAAAPGELPRIAAYGGRGPLRGWLRVSAIRTALNVKRDTAARDHDGMPEAVTTRGDPELAYFHALYRDQLQHAFGSALSTLSTDERNVMRLHYLDGLNIDRIGGLYQVHRATAARWLHHARARILAETRRQLVERLGIASDELDSVIRLVHSQLDVSIRRYLNEPAA